MRPVQRAAVTGLFAIWLAPLGAAQADSQSSNSSTNCSDGRCTSVETRMVEDRLGRRGWTRVEAWREPQSAWGPGEWRRLAPAPWQAPRLPRRERDDDDDED